MAFFALRGSSGLGLLWASDGFGELELSRCLYASDASGGRGARGLCGLGWLLLSLWLTGSMGSNILAGPNGSDASNIFKISGKPFGRLGCDRTERHKL